MGGLFNPDNTFFRGMSKVWDMFFVSILWAICCIPGYFLLTLVTSTLSDPIQLFIYYGGGCFVHGANRPCNVGDLLRVHEGDPQGQGLCLP